MMEVQPDQYDPNRMHNIMTCRDCVKPTIYVDGIDTIIDTQILKTPHIFLVNLMVLDNGIKPDIGTLNKYREDIL